MSEETDEQPQNRHNILEKEKNKASHLAPWQFKKGQSGNPKGRHPGKSMKEFAKEYLASLSEEERLDYFEGMNKAEIWKMAEGNPETKADVTSGGKPIIVLASEIAQKHEINSSPSEDSQQHD